MRIICYIHAGVLDINVTQPLLDDIIQRIRDSGLYSKLERINIGAVGKDWKQLKIPNKATIVYNNEDASVYEIPTLNHMRDFASKNPDTFILYLHTKGATQKRCNGKNYQLHWSRLMQHFCINHHNLCTSLLKKYKTVGCLMKHDHYCGNFWWARGDHVAQKQHIPPDTSGWGREAEFWIMNPPISNSHISLFDSKFQHGSTPPCNGLYGNKVDYENKLNIRDNSGNIVTIVPIHEDKHLFCTQKQKTICWCIAIVLLIVILKAVSKF